ncbi:DUF6612 family protein [Gorillibacterium massiliense]|uniref:DUF6612 family protein n=1 Tax=Gorillibacterium massiliense TaxID=1280390 RepID=UPI0004B8F656|nr:DUF6612 family protein [Gorillibacterium massiliense]
MFKKWAKWGIAVLLISTFMLSGCTKEQSEKAADVYAKTLEASNKLESFAMDMTMNMQIAQGSDKIATDSKITSNMIVKPEIQMDMNMETSAQGQNVKMQLVLNKDGFYMQDQTGKWQTLPKDQIDQVMSSVKQEQNNPADQLEKLKQFVDDFSVKESGDSYTLSLSAKGDKFKSFVEEQLDKQLASQPGMAAALNGEKPEYKFNKVEYTFVLDKQTYNPKELDMVMDAEITIKGETVGMVIDMKSQFNKFNEITEIKTPEGV